MDKPLTEQQVRAIFQEEMSKNYRAGAPQVAPHNHDGNNNLQINQKNVIYNNKFQLNTAITPPGGEIVIRNGIFNPTAVYFTGIARTPISGGATTKCQLTGFTQLGSCFRTDGVHLLSLPEKQIHANTCTTFTNVAGAWVPTVNTADAHFVAVFDGSFNLVGTIDIRSFTNTSITFSSTLSADWEIIGGINII